MQKNGDQISLKLINLTNGCCYIRKRNLCFKDKTSCFLRKIQPLIVCAKIKGSLLMFIFKKKQYVLYLNKQTSRFVLKK